MIVQVVYMEAQPEVLNAFIEEARANVQASLQEPGVNQFDLLQSEANPLQLMLYEVYRTAEAMEEHRKTPHYKRWVEVALPMLTKDRTRVLYQVLAPQY